MHDLPAPAKVPCPSCPYRRDVPSGIWTADEYAKLPAYDGPTWAQPLALFMCHQANGRICSGWLACHDTDHLLALRCHRVAPEAYGYRSPVAVFESGAEAAAHGLEAITAPDAAASGMIAKLERQRSRRRLA